MVLLVLVALDCIDEFIGVDQGESQKGLEREREWGGGE